MHQISTRSSTDDYTTWIFQRQNAYLQQGLCLPCHNKPTCMMLLGFGLKCYPFVSSSLTQQPWNSDSYIMFTEFIVYKLMSNHFQKSAWRSEEKAGSLSWVGRERSRRHTYTYTYTHTHTHTHKEKRICRLSERVWMSHLRCLFLSDVHDAVHFCKMHAFILLHTRDWSIKAPFFHVT